MYNQDLTDYRAALAELESRVVEDVPVKQGMSVKMGDRLVGVMDLSRLWLWANFYENEMGLLRVGQKLDISFPAFPGKKFEGQIGAIDRRLDAMKRTTRVRIDFDNSDDRLRPGMFANVDLKIDGGEGLTVPLTLFCRRVSTGVHREQTFPGEAGLLGNGLLSKFRLTIDQPGNRVIFENPI